MVATWALCKFDDGIVDVIPTSQIRGPIEEGEKDKVYQMTRKQPETKPIDCTGTVIGLSGEFFFSPAFVISCRNVNKLTS
jgi:hypothetical protein